MPAEAELLCDYFLASKLSAKKKSVESISAAAVLLKKQKLNKNTSSFATKDHSFDSIEFVKYEKNPMDYLKAKYTLMNGTGCPTNNKISKHNDVVNKPIIEKNNFISDDKVIVKKQAESILNMNWSKVKRNGIGLLNIGINRKNLIKYYHSREVNCLIV